MLSVLSVLGVLQSAVLSILFFKKRNLSAFNKHISGLFILLALAMLTISLPESAIKNARDIFEVFEFSLTFSAGPILYIIALGLLEKDVSWKQVTVQFIPAILFLSITTANTILNLSIVSVEKVPAMIPVIHMQLYTIWLCRILIKDYRKGDFKPDTGYKWLVMILILLISIHFAQWIRFIYSDVDWLKLIVPVTAFVSVYGLTFYGFLESGLIFKLAPDKNSFFEKHEKKKQTDELLRIIDEKKVYQNPDLTLDEFSRIAGLPAYKVSHLINHALKTGFNEWINSYRVEKVKDLLNDSTKSHFTIEAIAREAGFNSRSAFYQAFKKETGMTPAQFRKNEAG
ncbi:MAG: AraC family transcriptional regulator [Balneolaceae bacterium]|nr:AraC family transcriptional regulator [Balneolaceae bacterium]